MVAQLGNNGNNGGGGGNSNSQDSTSSSTSSTTTSTSTTSIAQPTAVAPSSTPAVVYYTPTTSTSYSPSTPVVVTGTTPTLQPSKSSSSSKGVPTGTVAGAAVAAAVGGALVAFILTFLIMRSRKKKQLANARFSEKRSGYDDSDSGLGLKAQRQDLVDPRRAWEKHLHQPADDNSIRLSVKTIIHQLELHVESFYADLPGPVNMNGDLQGALHRVDSPHLPDSVIGLLPQSRHQSLLIKHCLAHLVLSSISSEATGEQSFLPADFVALPQSIGVTRNTQKPGYHQAISRWRVLTSYLRPDPATDQAYIHKRDSDINIAAENFCNAFYPWANNRQTPAARKQNLVEIMKSAANTGILIFSQPASFDFLWTLPADGRRSATSIVVTPGFAKVADDKAKPLEQPYIMVQQTTNEI